MCIPDSIPAKPKSPSRRGHLSKKEAAPLANIIDANNGVPIISIRPVNLVVIFVLSISVAFGAGLASRRFVLKHYGPALSNLGLPIRTTSPLASVSPSTSTTPVEPRVSVILPEIPGEKKAPQNKYTFKQFEAAKAVRSYSMLLEEGQDCDADTEICENTPVTVFETEGADSATSSSSSEPNNHKDTEIHEPAGQHLLIDMEHVDSAFLNSEERLATAMIELIQLSKLTLLSYHCHGLEPMGVSCVGVLLESHVSFHTWPLEGVITLDLFTCGPGSLLPLVSTVKQLFGIPIVPPSVEDMYDYTIKEEPEEPRMVWGHKRRGFRDLVTYNIEETDFYRILGSMNLMREHVSTETTNFQKIDIFDFEEPRFAGDTTDGTPIPKDRLVFLDSVLQSRTFGEAAYHESLVHPAMFTHPNPRRVVIVGGGEGATLREVLKHNTVEEVIMIEIDEMMVNVSRQYLPEWSDCRNIAGSADSCFDDPRSKVYFEDAISWFIDRFGATAVVTESDCIDVIIMDALDPDSVVDFSDLLYDNTELVQAFSRSLGKNGIFVAQVGEGEQMDDSPEQYHANDHFATFLQGLGDSGFDSITDYGEIHGRFGAIWSFLLAMKSSVQRSRWFMNEAEMQLDIRARSMKSNDGASLFNFFDGASLMHYQFPSRVVEETWCRGEPNECSRGHGFDPEILDMPRKSFEVKTSEIAGGGRGVFATEFIPKGSYIGLEECVHGMFVPSRAYETLEESGKQFTKTGSKYWDVFFWGYVEGYGWVDSAYGDPAAGIDPGILTFVNHGCNGTYNVGTKLLETESTARLGHGPAGIFEDSNDVFNPFDERHFPMWDCADFVALRDIETGEEILDNYLTFGGSEDINDWEDNLQELKEMCNGETGRISKYEETATK